MKQPIDPLRYAGEIMTALQSGVLLTTQSGGRLNTMTISWGTLGVEWGVPIFTAFVREGRYTRQLLDESREFTVSSPHGPFDRRILGFCGSKSGRDLDKFQALGLTPEPPERISVPGIRQLPLTLECRVVYLQPQIRSEIPPDLLQKFYPQDVESTFCGSNRDLHTAYYGEIVSAYLISDRP